MLILHLLFCIGCLRNIPTILKKLFRFCLSYSQRHQLIKTSSFVYFGVLLFDLLNFLDVLLRKPGDWKSQKKYRVFQCCKWRNKDTFLIYSIYNYGWPNEENRKNLKLGVPVRNSERNMQLIFKSRILLPGSRDNISSFAAASQDQAKFKCIRFFGSFIEFWNCNVLSSDALTKSEFLWS